MNRLSYGKLGENIACYYLINKDFNILNRNYRYKNLGEIDIISERKNILYFIEVKTRSGVEFDTHYDSIDNGKIRNMIKTSEKFLEVASYKCERIRYSAIFVLINRRVNKLVKVEFYNNII